MYISTSEIVDKVFDEFMPRIMKLSSNHRETSMEMKEMHTKLSGMLYEQYYNNTSRFMKSIDVEDMLGSSPPRTQMIKKMEPKTPLK